MFNTVQAADGPPCGVRADKAFCLSVDHVMCRYRAVPTCLQVHILLEFEGDPTAMFLALLQVHVFSAASWVNGSPAVNSARRMQDSAHRKVVQFITKHFTYLRAFHYIKQIRSPC